MSDMICRCGSDMEEDGNGITYADIVTIVWVCKDCGRTVEKEFHPVLESWTEPIMEVDEE